MFLTVDVDLATRESELGHFTELTFENSVELCQELSFEILGLEESVTHLSLPVAIVGCWLAVRIQELAVGLEL